MEIVLLVALAALAGWYFFLRQKKEDFKAPEAPYKVETPVVAPEPTPAPEPEQVVGKPADEHVEATAPVEKPKKKATKPKAPKAPKAEAAKTKPATKGAKVKRTK